MDMIKIFLLIFIISAFVFLHPIFAQNVPVIENRSRVLAKVKAVILYDFPNVELVLQVIKSENIEGYRNLVKDGQIILASPLHEDKDLFLCYYLKPYDEVNCVLELVGDERGRKWIIREIERVKELSDGELKEVIEFFLIGKGIIKEGEDFDFQIEDKMEEKMEDKMKIKVNVKEKEIYLIMDSSYSILF
ncbi:MAG TPA: hypothetical protein PKW23_05740 [Dictyoglomaceae bacterium]|nr:hypothetical protein [Dictyoglomaceae bacterium]HOL39878.1 hypothetical protein [Dictyoglomaceae bacterium]HPP16298.1 hypothetical protein [Dictyoglomaceae bacterium]